MVEVVVDSSAVPAPIETPPASPDVHRELLLRALDRDLVIVHEDDSLTLGGELAERWREPKQGLPLPALFARVHPADRNRFAEALRAHRAAPAGLVELAVHVMCPETGWRRARCRMMSRRGPAGAAQTTFIGLVDESERAALTERATVAERQVELLKNELARARERFQPPRARGPSPHAGESDEDQRRRKRSVAVRAALGRVRTALGPASPHEEAGRGSVALRNLREALDRTTTRLGSMVLPDVLPVVLRSEAMLEEVALVALNARLEALRTSGSDSGLAAVAARLAQLAVEAKAALEPLRALEAPARAQRDGCATTLEPLRKAADILEEAISEPERVEVDWSGARAALAEAETLLAG